MAWLHPVLGGLAVLALLGVGMMGLRARHRMPYAPGARRSHRRFATPVFVAVLAAGLTGLGSVLFVRDDLDPAASWHFRVCVPVVLLMTVGWWTSRRLPQDAGARRLHPVIGLVAMLGGLVGGFLGLGMLP